MPNRSRALITAAIATTLVGATACSQVPRAGMGAGFQETGTFRFEVRAKGEMITEGWINVTRDTVVVRATPGPCRYDREARARGSIVYICSDRRFSFDRRRPISRAWVTYPQRVVSTRRVCGHREADARGNLVCTTYEPETVERFVQTSIRLEPIRQ